MHIRLNIPAWDGREVRFGLKALLSAGPGSEYRDRLLGEVTRLLSNDWTPVLLSSARYGLTLALRSLQLEGCRVAVPGYVCPAVLTGLAAAGVEPVPVDCEQGSIRFNPLLLRRSVANDGIAAVVALNTYGLDQDFAMLHRLGLPIIEDAAYQAGLIEEGGSRLCGTRGDAGVWSFNFKALAGVGGGAMLLRSRDTETHFANGHKSNGIGEAARFFNYALRSVGRHRIPRFLPGAESPAESAGTNVRRALREVKESPMSELQAGVAFAQWQSRDEATNRQQANAARLGRAIENCDSLASLARRGSDRPVHLFPVLLRVSDEDAPAAVHRVRLHLYRKGVQTETAYPMTFGSAETPASNSLSKRLLLVPCNASLRPAQIELIARSLEQASQLVAREFRIASEEEVRA